MLWCLLLCMQKLVPWKEALKHLELSKNLNGIISNHNKKQEYVVTRATLIKPIYLELFTGQRIMISGEIGFIDSITWYFSVHKNSKIYYFGKKVWLMKNDQIHLRPDGKISSIRRKFFLPFGLGSIKGITPVNISIFMNKETDVFDKINIHQNANNTGFYDLH